MKLKEIEQLNEKKKSNIIKRIKYNERFKEEYEKEKEKLFLKTQSLKRIKNHKLMLNKEKIYLKNENRREEILNGEYIRLNRIIVRESEINDKRKTSQMLEINDRIEFEEQIKHFLKERRYIQSQSIMRKNKKEKLYIYQGILKKEEEKKRRLSIDQIRKIK